MPKIFIGSRQPERSRASWQSEDFLTKAETVTVTTIEAGLPTLVEAREIIAGFHLMIRKTEEGLNAWIERARASLVVSFARGVAKDEAAGRAAITSYWSNGQT
jgi:transposase